MHFQSKLVALGKARLQLFETFCLLMILGQRDKDFILLIRIDPELPEELLLPMKTMVEPYKEKIFRIASNDNTEGFRQLVVKSMNIVSDDSKVLAQAVSKSHNRWLAETRLDADDFRIPRSLREPFN